MESGHIQCVMMVNVYGAADGSSHTWKGKMVTYCKTYNKFCLTAGHKRQEFELTAALVGQIQIFASKYEPNVIKRVGFLQSMFNP